MTSDTALRVVGLVAEHDGRERAVGNIRLTNTSDSEEAVISRITVRDPQNAKVGLTRMLRLESPESEVAGTGYPVPPRPEDDMYERTGRLWDRTIEAIGASIAPGERVNLVVGLAQPDPALCSLTSGIDIVYELGGEEYVTTWHTHYVIEPTSEAGCARTDGDPETSS